VPLPIVLTLGFLRRNIACRTCTYPRPVPLTFGGPTNLPLPQATSPRFQNTASAGTMPQLLLGFSSLNLGGTGRSVIGGSSSIGADSPLLYTTVPEYIHAQVQPAALVHKFSTPRQSLLLQPQQQFHPPQRHITDSPHRHNQQPLGSVVPQHILTPSGRAFSQGGRVQNISSGTLPPCIMFWPDNEPLPELGQVRPSAGFSVTVCSTSTLTMTRARPHSAYYSILRSSTQAIAALSSINLGTGFVRSVTI
jgi:hypothetical protein